MLNGDINFKLNKKIGIALLCGMSLFAAADFVSLVDVKSAGGIVIEKETMTVGAVVLRMDNTNPADIYGGTWELITGDATLTFGKGSNLSGEVIGTNNKTVPLPAHSHTFTGNPLPAHSHNQRANGGDGGSGNSYGGHAAETKYSNATRQLSITTAAASSGTPTGTISTSGEEDATMDVRGARIAINVWKRVN